MRIYKNVFSVTLFLTIGILSLHAQESINTAGKSASGSGGDINYSVGQVVVNTIIGTNGSLSQGVQQTYDISAVTGIDFASDIELVVMVYPNPTTDFLRLKVENYKFDNLSYQLFSINGKLIESNTIENIETKIFMKNLVPASYLLRLLDKDKEIKIFQIIKK